MVPTVAVVTGGGRGIGAATSLRLARAGHRILLTYHSDSRSAEEVVEAIRASGTDAVAVKVDCSNRSEVSILAEHPWVISGVAVLVLNHGRYDRQPAATVPFEDLRRTMATNFEGAVHVWNAIHPHLSDESRTVVIGSQLGIRGSPHGGDYAASKGALHAWARSIAQDMGPAGHRVNVIAPGYIATDLLAGDSDERRAAREEEVPLRRVGAPEDVAGVVAFLASEDASYLTGRPARQWRALPSLGVHRG